MDKANSVELLPYPKHNKQQQEYMAYISSIVVDFGSSNSGCARIELESGHSMYKTPTFLQGSQFYAKDDTWFYVRPDFWDILINSYQQVADNDFAIRSRVLPYTNNPNIIWGRQHISALSDVIEENEWIGFKHFKMNLYHHKDYVVNGITVPIKDVVRLFLRILEVECLTFESDRRHRSIMKEEIQWGITIPTIWGDREKSLMTEIAAEVFGNHVRILSEPEGPILSSLLHSSRGGDFSLKKGRISLVADIGGGTTDITLIEEVSDDPSCEYPLRVVAATDGVGVGGNNIDDSYWIYILRYLSRAKTSDNSEIVYDNLNDEELKRCLLLPFTTKIRDYIEMEDSWLKFKHGESRNIQFPPSYLKWLKNNGHSQVANVLTNVMIGIDTIDKAELNKAVFEPTYRKICEKIKSFLEDNTSKIPRDIGSFIVIKAGGLSLSSELRDKIDMLVGDLGIKYTSGSLSSDPVSTSGSIMDGACIVLLNRKVINRKAPFNIYYDMGCSLRDLQEEYKNLEINLGIGYLNDLFEKDSESGALRAEKAVPVAIKGKYFKDHNSTSFSSRNTNQGQIEFHFFGTDEGYIVLPHQNPRCFILGSTIFEKRAHKSFKITIDFNESPTNNNFHYYIISVDNNEIVDEGNIPICKTNNLRNDE